jgi:hypothetical protein
MEPRKGSEEPFAEREWNGELARELPSTHLARMAHNYWAEAAASGGQSRMRDFAMDVVDYVAMLVERGEPGGNWETVYDTWLARASRHARIRESRS